MNTFLKVVTGFLCLVHLAWTVVGLVNWIWWPEPTVFSFAFARWMLIFPILSFGLTVYFCVHLSYNQDVGKWSRVLWFCRFFLASPIAFPIYWLAYMVRD